jgi:hypothetical protein
MTGFETGSLSAEPRSTFSVAPAVVGAATIESGAGNVRTGTYSLKVAPASGAAGYWDQATGSFQSQGFLRVYVKVTVLPATARNFIGSRVSAETALNLNPDGSLELFNNAVSAGSSSTLLTDTARWYRVELKVDNAGNTQELLIDGVSQVTDTYTNPAVRMRYGATDTVAATYTAYFDDISFDGAAYPGAGSVVLLRATSLNAAGGWVEGDGAGTAGMAGAVSTRPPAGVASASETSATNIESPTNSATDNCDMNMTTYTAAGVASGDTINALLAFVRHGEDIATSTKTGALKIVSNPDSGTETTFTYGDDVGAHGAEVGNWRTTGGVTESTIVSSPSVTLGTSPVMRVGKRTATTRVVCVDFMGIYVDYTPASAAVPRHGFVNHQEPGVFCKAHQALRRWRHGPSGILVPETVLA